MHIGGRSMGHFAYILLNIYIQHINICINIHIYIHIGGRGMGHFANGFKGGVHLCNKPGDVAHFASKMLGISNIYAFINMILYIFLLKNIFYLYRDDIIENFMGDFCSNHYTYIFVLFSSKFEYPFFTT